ncbi:DUF6249 domain-containing protein [Winogradskyella sp.]|uniref:DUF6249 domain-containing protein n=1 Tax=Winogradskyella sp. TaxID=1883156 RepID=UPI003BA8E6A9
MVTTLSHLLSDIPIGPIFLVVAIVVVFYLWTQYRQKMELIKKGESIVNFDSLEQMKINHLGKGIISITMSLGILVGHLLQSYMSLDPWVSYSTMLLLFFGIGALVFYGLIRDQ